MNKATVGVVTALVVLGAAGWYTVRNNTQGGADVEFRYAPVSKGELFRSTSGTGNLVPLTTVTVRSKAGGTVVRLAVEEGTVVNRGDLIALIDPRDTRTLVEQAQADLAGAEARVRSAEITANRTVQDVEQSVRDARIRLDQARIRLKNAQESAKAEPMTYEAQLENARASVRAAEEAMKQLKEVDLPQRRRDAETTLERTRTQYETSQAAHERAKQLYDLGYVSKADLDRAASDEQSSRSSFLVAQQRMSTLESELEIALRTQQTRVDQAKSSLRQTEAGAIRLGQSQRDVEDAQKAVEQAEIALKNAEINRANVQLRRADLQSAQSSAVRSRVSAQNAQQQLAETTVTAPRAGVVTQKYLEEGTIVPPATSAFAEGARIVEIADTSKMFVEVNVDESDISSVKVGMPVRIAVEAYGQRRWRGVVRKIFPSAVNQNGVTNIRVRVEVVSEEAGSGRGGGRPGMGGGAPGGAPSAGAAGSPGAAGAGRASGSATSRQAERGGRPEGAAQGQGQGQRPQGQRGPGAGQGSGRQRPSAEGTSAPDQPTTGRPGAGASGAPRTGGMPSGNRTGGGTGAPGANAPRSTAMADQVLKPGMSATCEFIQIEIKDVLLVPQQAVQREDGKMYVRVKSSDPMKPERREVKLGELGNDGYQVLEGLKEGEEVVIAEINLQQLRERQARIEQQQQGGGFTAGTGGQGPQRR